MSPTIASTAGEVEKVIAEADRVVVDPANLTTRQIVAGQPIPPDLMEAEDAENSIVGHEFQEPGEAATQADTRQARAGARAKADSEK